MTQPSELLDRLPPQDLAAERAVLGSCLLVPATLDTIGSTLKPDQFYAEANRKLFTHMLAMRDTGPLDAMLLVDRLKKAGDLEAVGGMAYLAEVAESVAVAVHAPYYARIVADRATRRGIIHAMTECLQAAYASESEPVEEMLAKVETVLARIQTGQYSGEPTALSKTLAAVLDRAEAIANRTQTAGTMTGLWDLDNRLGGLFDGELFVLAARPRVGKTALACQIARHVAGSGRLVYFASLEMSDVELVTRMLCSEADVNSRRIRTGTLQTEDVAALTQTSNEMAGAKLLIHDRPGLSVADIRRTCRRLARRGLALVVLDYLQRVTPADKKLKRYEQVAEMAKDLKTLARELSVPVMCLAQLGRDAEREGRPQLHHLRESGDIEAEADVVAFVWRPAAWTEEETKAARKGTLPPAEQAALIIEKNRNGETATLRLRWEAHRTRFVPPEHQEPYSEFQQYSGDGDF